MHKEHEEKEIEYTPWVTFVWAISILSTILVTSIGISMSAKADAGKASTDMEWVKSTLVRMEGKLDTKE